MTAQISDECKFQSKNYFIAGVNGKGLFQPEEYGMKPYPFCSACWRGYICHYKVRRKKLLLDKLDISLNEKARSLNGQNPLDFEKDREGGMFSYRDLNLHIDFTGGLLLAKDFIHELYVHMGFHPAWKYERVVELIFQNGDLQEHRDVSDKIEIIRAKMIDRPLRPHPENGMNDLANWIESTFKLDYNL